MTEEQAMKRDLVREWIEARGGSLRDFKNLLDPIQYSPSGPSCSFDRAVEILYSRIEQGLVTL